MTRVLELFLLPIFPTKWMNLLDWVKSIVPSFKYGGNHVKGLIVPVKLTHDDGLQSQDAVL